MSNGDLFYICGSILAVSAVTFTFLGLRVERFPGRLASIVALWFVAFVGATTTFAVLHAKDEEKHEEAGLRAAAGDGGEDGTEIANANPPEETSQRSGEAPRATSGAKLGGGGSTLKLAADPTQIAFNTTELSAKPGKVEIDLDNPSALEHDVAIERGGRTIAASPRITEDQTSVTAKLTPGEYRFICTVPGHAEAGMEGTLTVR